MKVEKALNFCVEVINRKRVPVDGNVLRHETLSLYEDFKKKKKVKRKRKPSLLQQAENGCIGLRTGLISKTLKL